jgi:hypothetical protein
MQEYIQKFETRMLKYKTELELVCAFLRFVCLFPPSDQCCALWFYAETKARRGKDTKSG